MPCPCHVHDSTVCYSEVEARALKSISLGGQLETLQHLLPRHTIKHNFPSWVISTTILKVQKNLIFRRLEISVQAFTGNQRIQVTDDLNVPAGVEQSAKYQIPPKASFLRGRILEIPKGGIFIHVLWSISYL